MCESLLVACHSPLWRGGLVEDKRAVLALDTARDTVLCHGVHACRVCAFIAPHALAHVPKGRVVVAVWTEGVTLKEQHFFSYTVTQIYEPYNVCFNSMFISDKYSICIHKIQQFKKMQYL